MNYIAKGDKVYYKNPDTKADELFLTVHPTSTTLSVEEQAVVLASILDTFDR